MEMKIVKPLIYSGWLVNEIFAMFSIGSSVCWPVLPAASDYFMMKEQLELQERIYRVGYVGIIDFIKGMLTGKRSFFPDALSSSSLGRWENYKLFILYSGDLVNILTAGGRTAVSAAYCIS